MRKYLASILGFLLVFGAVSFIKIAPAEASVVESLRGADIRLGGDIRIRHQYLDNAERIYRPAVPDVAPKRLIYLLPRDVHGGSAFDQRVRLDLIIDVGDGVTGRILTELTDGNVLWAPENDRFEGDIRIRQAWIHYKTHIGGVSTGLKLGLMPLLIGKGWFADTDGTGIAFWTMPAVGTTLAIAYINTREPGRAYIDTRDKDSGSVRATHTMHIGDGDLTLGGNFTRVRSHIGDDPIGRVKDSLYLHNLSLTAEGEFGSLGIGATAHFQSGTAELFCLDPAPVVLPEVDFAGHAFTANVSYDLGAANVRAGFGRGSGGEKLIHDNEVNMFHTDVGALLFIYDDLVMSAAAEDRLGVRKRGIANTTFFTVGVTFEPTATKEVGVDIHFLRATETLAWCNSKSSWL
ncbi:hypothetical protein M1N42_01050 [Thermodesulfovibrionales bacterium]|nr:hypothetical protein [Thermodesulfovibrionales bacterium]